MRQNEKKKEKAQIVVKRLAPLSEELHKKRVKKAKLRMIENMSELLMEQVKEEFNSNDKFYNNFTANDLGGLNKHLKQALAGKVLRNSLKSDKAVKTAQNLCNNLHKNLEHVLHETVELHKDFKQRQADIEDATVRLAGRVPTGGHGGLRDSNESRHQYHPSRGSPAVKRIGTWMSHF